MKKLAIVGTTYYHENAPYNDKNFEIWGVASCLFLKTVKRLDKVFEIHRKDEYIQDTYIEIYKTNLPVYTQKKDKKVKDCRIFPIKQIIKKYGEYITNSYTLMLLYAIEQGYKEIHFYGIDFETERERSIERPNLEYWIGYFRGKGIKIYFYHKNKLLKSSCIYGVDNILKLRKPFLNKIEKLDEEMESYLLAYHNEKLSESQKREIISKYLMLKGAKEHLEVEVSYL